MKEIGEILKQARIEKGYTLDDLQQITKIQKRYLEAVEEGNTEILPGRFYARAFIRQYADIVGLNGDDLLDEHVQVSSEEVSEEFAESMSSAPSRSKIGKNNLWTTIKEQLPTILIFILVAAILTIIYFAFRQTTVEDNGDSPLISDEQSEELVSPEEDEEDSAEEEKEPTAEEESPEEVSQEFTITDSSGDMTTYEVKAPHPTEQKITLKTGDGESWVSIQIDGETVETTTLAAESSVSADFSGEAKEITLRIGNANATTISVNENQLDYGENAQGTVQNMILNFTEE